MATHFNERDRAAVAYSAALAHHRAGECTEHFNFKTVQ